MTSETLSVTWEDKVILSVRHTKKEKWRSIHYAKRHLHWGGDKTVLVLSPLCQRTTTAHPEGGSGLQYRVTQALCEGVVPEIMSRYSEVSQHENVLFSYIDKSALIALTTSYSTFSDTCQKAAQGRESFFWLTVLKETVWRDREGTASGARGSWSRCIGSPKAE